MTSLKGKVALVTGGGGGIGRGICLRLASDQADIVVTDINTKSVEKVSEEVRGLGVKSLGIFADILISRLLTKWFQGLLKNGRELMFS